MSEFKGTKGPWRYHVAINYYGFFVTHGPEIGQRIAATFRSSENPEANARLISSAPELLKALKEMVDIVKANTYPTPDKSLSAWGRMEAAEAVIAKALGDNNG